MTDNAWCYTRSTRVDRSLEALGAHHVTIRPHRPQTNGKAERFNRTLLEEWAYTKLYRSNEARLAGLATFINFYNRRRPHTALGGRAASPQRRHLSTRIGGARSGRPVDWRARQRPQPAAGREEEPRGRPDGGRHVPRQAAWDRLPVQRDLRWAALVVGLRPPRRRAPPQHPQRLVALDGPAPRRRRRPGGRDHHVAEGLGGERPRGRVPRPARRVPELPPALPPGSPGRGPHLSELRPEAIHGAPAVQPDVQDPHGPRRGRVERGLPPTRDGAGDVRRLRDRPADLAEEDPVRRSRRSASRSATRSRRGTSSSARASSSRWRWSTSSSPAPTTSGSSTG